MLASEKKFITILDEMFIGVRVQKSDETIFEKASIMKLEKSKVL